MQPLSSAAPDEFDAVDFVLTDLDDTVTLDGALPAASYAALEALQNAGKTVVIVTGRPAGWCDLMARFFPVAAVVGENGAFYFRYDRAARTMRRVFQRSDAQRALDRHRLGAIYADVVARYPDVSLSADQAYRISDLAVDFCEDVPRLPAGVIDDIVAMFTAGGATAKVSSIHVNAWIGDFSKLEMSLRLLNDEFGVDAGRARERVLYAGDSPNDEPMFAYFRHTVGVANIAPFAGQMVRTPRFLTQRAGGLGFAEIASRVLKV